MLKINQRPFGLEHCVTSRHSGIPGHAELGQGLPPDNYASALWNKELSSITGRKLDYEQTSRKLFSNFLVEAIRLHVGLRVFESQIPFPFCAVFTHLEPGGDIGGYGARQNSNGGANQEGRYMYQGLNRTFRLTRIALFLYRQRGYPSD